MAACWWLARRLCCQRCNPGGFRARWIGGRGCGQARFPSRQHPKGFVTTCSGTLDWLPRSRERDEKGLEMQDTLAIQGEVTSKGFDVRSVIEAYGARS